MSENNINIVKTGYERYLNRDMPGFLNLMADNVVWDHQGPKGVPFNQIYHGQDGVAEFLKTVDETMETLEMNPREFFGSGERVVVLGFSRYRVRETKKEFETDWAMTFTLKDGKVTHWKPIMDFTAQAEAFQPARVKV